MKQILLTFALLSAVLAAPAQSWTNRYNGLGNDLDEANAVALDNNGNAFVTGRSVGSGGNGGCATIKYSNAGIPLWTNWLGNFGGRSAIAVGSNGNVVVAGTYEPIGSTNAEYVTIAFSNAGVPLWTNRYNGTGNSFDEARAVAVDANGNVFVTGSSWDGIINAWVNAAFATIAYSSAGVPLWTNRYRGQGSYSTAVGLTVDRSGNVIVTGISDNNEGFGEYATIKYSPAGLPLWTNLYGGLVSTVRDYSSGVAVDDDGNVFVTGSSDFPADYATIKYSSAGVPLWINRYHGPSIGGDPSFDAATAIAVDGSGNLLVTGYSSESGFANPDYLTIKYSGAGVPLWTNRYNGPGNESDTPLAMAVGGTGSVFVTGRSSGSVGFDDYATIAYSSEGVPLWTNRYNGTGNFVDEARAVAVDGNGNVFVTGSSANSFCTEPCYDYLTIKYAASEPVSSPSLSIQRLANSVVLSWTNAAFGLQSAPSVTGTFTNVPGATSPYTNPISGGQRFFRLAQ